MAARGIPRAGGGDVTKIVLIESRWGPAILILLGVCAIYFALEVEFTSYRTHGREPLVFLCGAFSFLAGLGRLIRPTTIVVQETEIVVRRMLRRELVIPWSAIAGFFEKHPGGIGINLTEPFSSAQATRWLDGSGPDEVFIVGLWPNRSRVVGDLNTALESHSSSSMSQ